MLCAACCVLYAVCINLRVVSCCCLLCGAAKQLGIGHYGLSTPSLEEIFLRTTTEPPTTGDSVPPSPVAGTSKLAAELSIGVELGNTRHGGSSSKRDDGFLGGSSNSPTCTVDDNSKGSSCEDMADVPLSDAPAMQNAGISAVSSREDTATSLPVVNGESLDDSSGNNGIHPGATGAPLSPERQPHAASCADNVDADSALRPSKGGDATARGGWRNELRCFGEMVRKRAIVASRDVRGAFFTLLLPVLAVAAVLVGTVLCIWCILSCGAGRILSFLCVFPIEFRLLCVEAVFDMFHNRFASLHG